MNLHPPWLNLWTHWKFIKKKNRARQRKWNDCVLINCWIYLSICERVMNGRPALTSQRSVVTLGLFFSFLFLSVSLPTLLLPWTTPAIQTMFPFFVETWPLWSLRVRENLSCMDHTCFSYTTTSKQVPAWLPILSSSWEQAHYGNKISRLLNLILFQKCYIPQK